MEIIPKNWDKYDNIPFIVVHDEIKVGDYFLNGDKIYKCDGFAGHDYGKIGDSMPSNKFILCKKSQYTFVRLHCKKIIFIGK